MGVTESNALSECPMDVNIIALIVPWITQVGDQRNHLIMGRGRWTKSILSHMKYDRKCYVTAVFFGMITVPDIATNVYEEKLWKETDEVLLRFGRLRIKWNNTEE
jgi:hypothetical protein